jgi:hypothetical protein
MGRVRGVAGSSYPEVDGVFLCRDEFEVDFFSGMNANDGPIDVWAVEGVSSTDLVESPEGFLYLPQPIARGRLTLWQRQREPGQHAEIDATGRIAYGSTLTISLSDGRVLRDDEALRWDRLRPPEDG